MRERHSEVELKFLAPPQFELPQVAGPDTGVARAIELEPQELSATYFDTPELDLLRNGITFRYRTGEPEGPAWTVKLPAGKDTARRTELNYPGDGGVPPEAALDVLKGVRRGLELHPLAELRTRRRPWSLMDQDGGHLADLVDDRVTILNGNKIADTFREIEIEAVSADRKQLEKMGATISRSGGTPEQRSKFSRAVEALGREPLPARSAAPSPDDSATSVIAPMLAVSLQRLLANDPHARLGDAEGIHQLRVGVRRLRSVFRTFAPLLADEGAGHVIEDLRWLGRILGAVRDLDVVTALLKAQSSDMPGVSPLFVWLSEKRAPLYRELLVALSSERYLAFLDATSRLAAGDLPMNEETGSAAEVLPELVRDEWRKFVKVASNLGETSSVQEFHDARIKAKRARYAAELAGEFTKGKERKRLSALASQAEAVQNTLGEQQDAYTASAFLLEAAVEHPSHGPLNLALGRLLERQDAIARARTSDYFGVWRKLRHKRL